MAISHHPQNKFAFLFTGSADPQYVTDLRRVTETLIKFYGYPAANIKVVAGAAVADFIPHTPPDPNNIFETPGLVPYILGTGSSNLKTDLTLYLEAFLDSLDHPYVDGYNNSVFLYFTGNGTKTGSDETATYFLTIGMNGTTEVTINQGWLKGELAYFSGFFPYNNINILMQQSYSYGFFEGIGGIFSLAGAGLQLTFTSSCNTIEPIDADINGSSFTKFWTQGLQFSQDSGGKFADQQNTATTTPAEPVSEDTDNFLISFKKAWCFAGAQSGKTPRFDLRGDTSLDYPGLPAFLFHDGSPNIAESPDIKISPYEAESKYIPDSGSSVNNTIKLHVEWMGTHPLRSICINLGIYRSSELVSVDEPALKAEKSVSGLLKPGDLISDIEFDNLQFLHPDYNSIVARAALKCNGIFSGIDNSVNIEENDFEAQRNITMFEDDFLCTVSHTDVSATGVADGQITIVASGGVPFPLPSPHYEYNIDGGTYGTSGTFNNLNGGNHTVSARDSAGHSCSQTVDLTYSIVVQQCEQLLDNRYIHICRTTSGSLKCTFKPYPHLPEGYYRTRAYKIRWKPPIPHPVTPAIPPDDIVEFHNVTIVASGLDHIGGSYRPYIILRVSDNRTGEIVLKYPKSGLAKGSQRISVPVKIYFRKVYGIWPPWWRRWPWRWDWRWPWDWRLSWPWRWPYRWRWPWLWPFSWWRQIARFKLIIVPHIYDIEEY